MRKHDHNASLSPFYEKSETSDKRRIVYLLSPPKWVLGESDRKIIGTAILARLGTKTFLRSTTIPYSPRELYRRNIRSEIEIPPKMVKCADFEQP